MNPIRYIKDHTQEIIEECDYLKLKTNGDLVIAEIKSFINDLSKIRISQKKTINRCREYVKQYDYQPSNGNSNIALPTSNIFDYQSFIFTKWVISALKEDDSYTYGYNCMVQFFNRNSGTLPITIKENVDVSTVLSAKTDSSELLFKSFFIDETQGDKLMPYLIEHYKVAKAQQLAFLIFALIKLNLVNKTILENQTLLYKALVNDFSWIGTRQALNINITKLKKTQYTPDLEAIDRHSKTINDFLLLICSKK